MSQLVSSAVGVRPAARPFMLFHQRKKSAWLKWRPQFINSFSEQVSASKESQPAAIQTWISFWSHLINTNPHLFAYVLASAETAIAVFLIFGFLTNLTCE